MTLLWILEIWNPACEISYFVLLTSPRSQTQQEYEERLKAVQRSTSTSVNVDIYKRKLAAQRMDHLREVDMLKQQIQGVQGGRARPRF